MMSVRASPDHDRNGPHSQQSLACNVGLEFVIGDGDGQCGGTPSELD